MLSKFFYQRTKKELFVCGENFDQEIMWKFGWLFWLEPFIWWILPRIEIILLFDQVSRHYYRNTPEKFQEMSLKLMPILSTLSLEELESMNLLELAFTSLATRHLLKIISQTENSGSSALSEQKSSALSDQARPALSEPKSSAHQIISRQLELMIEVTRMRLEFRSPVSIPELVLAIHSKNKETLRFFRYIEADYQVWSQPPIINQSSTQIDNWSVSFLESTVAKHVIRVLTEVAEKSTPDISVRFYVMCSGGIDSMTLVRIFNGLRLTGQIPNASFGAIHIDWGKRNESRKEARALAQFLALIGMPYRVIKSPINPTAPNWDQLSTEYRFRLLKTIQCLDNLFDVKLIEHTPSAPSLGPANDPSLGPANDPSLGPANNPSLGTTNVPSLGSTNKSTYFCLGHIADDLIENLICNVCLEGSPTGKQTYFDLFGMKELTEHRDVWLLRPLLLHKKPCDLDTPYFKDNATQLDNKRRVVRRAIHDLGYNLSRINHLYFQALEMRQKYRNHPIINLSKSDSSNSILATFEFDKRWTLAEWEEVIIGITDRLHVPCLKKTIIKELIDTFEQRPIAWWSGRVLARGAFKIRVNNNLIELEYT